MTTQEVPGDRGDKGITEVPVDVHQDIEDAVAGKFICPDCIQPSLILFYRKNEDEQARCYRHMAQPTPHLTVGRSRKEQEVEE